MAQTADFGLVSSMRAKILKPEPRNTAETSCISIGLRRSGLSLPYLRMACAYGMSGNFCVTGLPWPNSSNTPRSTGSTAANTSSWVTKLISMSS